VNHSFFLHEQGFSKNLTGVLVTRIVGDDPLNSLQGALVEKLNAELQKEETGQQIEVHASSEIVNENDGLKAAHERARAIGERLNATIVIWGRKIGEKQFYPRITVMAAPKSWRAVRERTHDEQSITELHLPKELVDEPFYLIHFAAGYAYLLQSNYGEALLHFKAALGRQGALPKELADLQLFAAYCHYSLGDSDEASADYDKAIADYDEVIRLDPKDVFAYTYRGSAYQGKGDYDKAIADHDEAIRLDPKGAKAYEIRGAAYHDKGDYDKAIGDYDEAIRLDPKYALPYNSFAWLLGTCPQVSFRDGKKAINYATKACELSKDPTFVDTLAAAYAEAGDFKQAIKWETKYLETPNLSEKDTTDGKSRLALYQAHKPYHAEKGPTSMY
jgi:tetratricopeptide (TPR) repeat protein